MASLSTLDIPPLYPTANATTGSPPDSILISGADLGRMEGILGKPGQHGDASRPLNQGLN